MSVLEKCRKEQSTVALFFATILLIPFQFMLFATALTETAISTVLTERQVVFPDTIPLIITYLLLPIVYCIVVSQLFHPKRLVSPINIQIGTITVFSIVIIYLALNNPLLISPQGFENLFTSVFFLDVFMGMIGFIQFIIVRWVIGLNFDSIERVSYSVNGSVRDILAILGNDFLIAHDFSRKKDKQNVENPIWVLKCRDPYGNSVILTIGKHNSDNDKTIIASTSYRTSLYGISKSQAATAMRTSIINDAEMRLNRSKLKLTLTPIENVDDRVSTNAYVHSLAATRSKTEITVEFLRNIPRYYLYAIIITIIAFVGVTIAFASNLMDSNGFVGALVVIVVALIIEIGVPLRDEIVHQKIEEID